jgi:ribose 5-phosphate isomerase B
VRIAIGADHAGFELKERLKQRLVELGHEVDDRGTHGTESTDYPDWGAAVADEVASGRAERGVLVCGTGIGMAIAANRRHGVRAAAVTDQYAARLARQHNDANVLALGSRLIAEPAAEELLRTFLETPFEGGRHQRRIAKLDGIEA